MRVTASTLPEPKLGGVTTEPKMTVQRTRRSSTRIEISRVKTELEEICSRLHPGDQVPSHTELMKELDASASVVLDVLNQLHRSGRIIRRVGAGTFIPNAVDLVETSRIDPVKTSAESHTIIVVAPPDNAFFAYFGDLMLSRCEARGLKVVYHPTRTEARAGYTPAQPAGNGEVYLCLSTSLWPLAERLGLAGHRVVAIADPALIGRSVVVPCVHVDNVHGAYVAAKHLIDLGHRRLAYAMIDENYKVGPRWEGLILAVADANHAGLGVTIVPIYNSVVESWSSNPRMVVEYFGAEDHPTGLCAWNDRFAVKLINVLSRAGISVPGDVSIVGYDNLPDDLYMTPQLTTVDQCVDQQIRFALTLLTQNPPPANTHTTVVTPTLVARESTCAPLHIASSNN